MGTYNLPRNVKGEGRILFIFTGKSMLYTAIGATVGFVLFYLPLSALGLMMIGIIIAAVFALIGFLIGTMKMPNIAKFKFTQTTGGENIDDIIRRAIKFRTKGRKIYIYKEENKNGNNNCGNCYIANCPCSSIFYV